MKTSDVLATLRAFHTDKLTLRQRHVAVARHVSNYEFNNTYQYVINREDTHLAWLEAAIADLGGTPDAATPTSVPAPGKGDAFKSLIEQDSRDAQGFVDKWRPRLPDVSHDRDRLMMQVIVGETLEQKRFFDQMLANRDDLLGRRTGGKRTGDGVLSERWLGN